ncbi:MAG: FtsX-like permease family protein [Verrucomicrobia bacterium]|nr:FtsX-like permease family protein [Verrucomicrobiota bacterium]
MKYLPLIWSNLRRRRLRTFLTLLSILVAFVLYGYLAAIKQALVGGVNVVGVDRLVVRHKVSIIQPLPVSYKERIAQIPGVALVTHCSWFGGVYQDPKNFFAQIAVEPEDFLKMYPEYRLPPAQQAAFIKTRTGAIAGRKLAQRFGWKVGDKIPIQATVWVKLDGTKEWDFDLVGIYDGAKKGTDTTQFFFHYDYYDEARAYTKGMVGWYIVKVKDPNQSAAVARAIDDEFANSPNETKAETEGAFVQAFAKQVGDIGTIMLAILSAVFFTILLVAGNTMAQSVRERTEELGVLKAMGFTRQQVLALVLAESCFLSGLGGLLGLGLASALIARGDPTGGSLPMFFFPTSDLGVGVLIVVALGLVTGIFPALQAMRLRIAEALRRM